MAALQSPGPENLSTSHHQGMTMVPVESLVPENTQLITPALAEAFDLPYNLSPQDFGRNGMAGQDAGRDFQAKEFQGSAKDGSGLKEFSGKDIGPGVTQMQPPQSLMQQTMPIKQQPGDFNYQRSMYGGAQQPLLGNFFPQQPPGPMPQQSGYPVEAQEQIQGFLRQQAALSGPKVPPVYPGMSPQFNGWMDPAVPAPYAAQTNPGKHPQDANLGSDPDNDDYQARALKRPRLVWTLQLHQRFVDAVEQLGLKNAVPKTIMQLMNVDGLTRENVASHLQKYRLQLRKDGGKGDGMVDEEMHKDLEPEQPRIAVSEGFK